MSNLDMFIRNICGTFNNNKQIKEELEKGKQLHPEATHINGICNEKIKNLPENFKGYFVIEESYYKQNNRTNTMPHLFLFTLNENEDVVLTSYELPDNISKEDFTNENKDLSMDYNKLCLSSKFIPITYKEENGIFNAEGTSSFNESTELTVKEKIESNKMYVSEVFRRDGKITFGFVDPIIYEKCSND